MRMTNGTHPEGTRPDGASPEGRPDGSGASAFEDLDPRLNVFALANGMDLAKGPAYRRLEWYTEGLERAILIEHEPDGAFRLGVLSWPTGSDEIRGRNELAGGLSAEQVVRELHSAIDAANDL
jgi:hypothetical protein